MSHKSARNARTGKLREYLDRHGRIRLEEVIYEEVTSPGRETEPETKRHRDRRPRNGSVDASKYIQAASSSSTTNQTPRGSVPAKRGSEEKYIQDRSYAKATPSSSRGYESKPRANEDVPESSPSHVENDTRSDYRTAIDYDDSTRRDWAGSGNSPTGDLVETMSSLVVGNENYTTGTGPPPIGPDRSQRSRNFSQEKVQYVGNGKAGDLVSDQHQSLQLTRQVFGTPGRSEKLDSAYRVRNLDHKKFFHTGRVFQTLWTDPWTSMTNGSNQTFLSNVSVVAYNEKVHSKVRRFVVVRRGNSFCTCLPVTSYDGRGIRKHGITLQEHGFIYSHERPGRVQGIDKDPLKVVLSGNASRLGEKSLINYAKPYTVEKNVKVKDVGQLDEISKKRLKLYFNLTITDDNSDADTQGPVPDRTPRTKEAELIGMGAGISQSAQKYPEDFTSIKSPFASNIPHSTSAGFTKDPDSRTALSPNTGDYYSNRANTQTNPNWNRQGYSGQKGPEAPVQPRSEQYISSTSGPSPGYNPKWTENSGAASTSTMRPSAPEYVPGSQGNTQIMSQYGPVAMSSRPLPHAFSNNQYSLKSAYQQPNTYQAATWTSACSTMDQRFPFKPDYYQADSHFQAGTPSIGNTYVNQPVHSSGYYPPNQPIATTTAIHPRYPPHSTGFSSSNTPSGGYAPGDRPSHARSPLQQAEVFDDGEEDICLPTREEISASRSRHDCTSSRHRRDRR